ncbi:MAG: hypothetical protein LBL07_07695 [Tannerella sp.]|jgi:hypothetical protein|nr:hypothetical protein [Tannerella sp.]
MGLFNKLSGIIGEAVTGKLSGKAAEKNEEKKEEIRNIFDSKVQSGKDYTVLAGSNMVTTKKLMKEVRTYYNYIIGYKDGDDPEIVIIPTTDDLGTVDEPAICKRSECTKAVYEINTGNFRISHPAFSDAPLDFQIIVAAAHGQLGALMIPVSCMDEFFPFTEFFQNRFAK